MISLKRFFDPMALACATLGAAGRRREAEEGKTHVRELPPTRSACGELFHKEASILRSLVERAPPIIINHHVTYCHAPL